MNSQVDDILRGSFDLHVHAGPDPEQDRRLDALDTARFAHEAEMAGFVLKSHQHPTAAIAHTLSRVYPGLRVAGSIALNREVGGLNPDAVRAAAAIGARVVWMPTFSARGKGEGPGLTLTDDSGALRPVVHEVLEVVRKHDMVLASGHASPREVLALFREAGAKAITRLVATHPSSSSSQDELAEMASLGALVEFTFLSCMPSFNTSTPSEIASSIGKLGVERCVVTTDFGQWMNPPPAEGMRMAIAALLGAGMAPSEVEVLVKSNPLRLVGFDS